MLRSSADADCSHPRVELKAISSTSTNQHIQAVPLPYFNCLEVECVAWLSSHTFPRPDEQKLAGRAKWRLPRQLLQSEASAPHVAC